MKAVVPESENDIDEILEDGRDHEDSTIIDDEEAGDEDAADTIGGVRGDEEA